MATIGAIFENGVFKPVEPVALPEHQRVQIDVRPMTQPVPRTDLSSELLCWAGAIDADVPDLCEHLEWE
jgi:predicted DNA-binding antitoxin AbrB/MazE fold protein